MIPLGYAVSVKDGRVEVRAYDWTRDVYLNLTPERAVALSSELLIAAGVAQGYDVSSLNGITTIHAKES